MLAAAASDPDTLRYDQAMQDTDADEWKAAMHKEITSLIAQGTWEIVSKEAATTKILPGVWTLRRKRHPDGRIKCLKARWCVRGDLQEAVSDTFAPVVMWSTVRLLMYFTLFFGFETRCIDFSNAFVQAPLNDPIFVHLSRGYHSSTDTDVCLKLNKSLYGIAQAPRLWFEHLKDKLERNGFTQSRLDPCLFYNKGILLVCYVDDIVMAGAEGKAMDILIEALRQDSDLTDEGELAAFLGIQVSKDSSGKRFILTQQGLADRIISALGLDDANPTWTPTNQDAVGSDVDGQPMNEQWNFRSIVGMLLYLSNNTRPDLAFSVHQCARFSHNPKQSHAAAIKAIGRYLKRTRHQGIIMEPSGDLAVDCHVDADFAGLWRREDDQSPLCVKSRTGYLISIGGCPLTWTSKLQTEIALSTMEAEYIALSQSMRELLPIRELVREMATAAHRQTTFAIRTYSRVFEDNNGCLILASAPRMTPRSKHIAVKYHFFRSHVASGAVKIVKIATTEQKADIFTKGLVRATFEKIRKLVMGW
jgi:Reverse transcriptase (RNA-dependent DNA polymerase)